MAKITAGGMAMAVIMTVCAALRTNAAPDPEPVVVLHMTDAAHVTP